MEQETQVAKSAAADEAERCEQLRLELAELRCAYPSRLSFLTLMFLDFEFYIGFYVQKTPGEY